MSKEIKFIIKSVNKDWQKGIKVKNRKILFIDTVEKDYLKRCLNK